MYLYISLIYAGSFHAHCRLFKLIYSFGKRNRSCQSSEYRLLSASAYIVSKLNCVGVCESRLVQTARRTPKRQGALFASSHSHFPRVLSGTIILRFVFWFLRVGSEFCELALTSASCLFPLRGADALTNSHFMRVAFLWCESHFQSACRLLA